jgi:hypothetical protein
MSKSFRTRVVQPLGYAFIKLGYSLLKVRGNYSISKPIDPSNVEILGDPAFKASVNDVSEYTLLDTGRLANLWQLCRLTDPRGSILEIGSYRGGAALHLSNACPQRKIYACDSFRGFEKLHPDLDKSFDMDMFIATNKKSVENLFETRNRNYEVIDGFFPACCAGRKISPVSFVHLDVDIYKATIESLNYLEKEKILMSKPLIVLDDYFRTAEGVNQAVQEFISANKDWAAFPMFPGQGLMVHKNWFL